MNLAKIRSRPLIALTFVGVAAIAAVFFLRLPSMSAETATTPAKVDPHGIITPATVTSPAFIDPSVYQFPVVLSKAQWRRHLNANQYFILREKGTEPPFTGRYWNNHQSGIYYSAATGQPLFSSKDKFNSGTGWPSFTKPIDSKAVVLDADNSDYIQRTEVLDSLSGSHLGHLFDDGPPPTGKRYCIDSAALIFVPTGGTPPLELAANNPAALPTAPK